MLAVHRRCVPVSWATHRSPHAYVTPSPAIPQQTAPIMVPATPPPLPASASQAMQVPTVPFPQACAVLMQLSTALQLAPIQARSAAALALWTATAHAVTQVRLHVGYMCLDDYREDVHSGSASC